MAYTYDELKHKTVAELREIASNTEHEALQGYTQLNKEHLLHALARAFGIEEHHHRAVAGDINGRWVRAVPSADGKTEPISWVFDPSEPRQIDILEQKIEGDTATFLIQMQTHTGPRARNPRKMSSPLSG